MRHHMMGPQGLWGSGENGYLFSGSWGALVIILGELGSKLIILEILGALPKSKKKNWKSLHLFYFLKIPSASGWGLAPQTPPHTPLVNSKCIYFRTNMLMKIELREKYCMAIKFSC